jgi:hypothetical protein
MIEELQAAMPVAELRAFGAIVSAILDEDFEGRQEAVRWAGKLSRKVAGYEGIEWTGPDAGVIEVARRYADRDTKGILDSWDVRALLALVQKAQCFQSCATLKDETWEVKLFNESLQLLDEVWRDDTSRSTL